jgi:ribokinase
MQPEDIDQAESGIAQSSIVMTQFEVSLEAVARVMELGRRNQATTILNPAPAKSVEKGLFENVDILTPNESETRILLGLAPDDPTPTLELSKRLLEFGVKHIVITHGKKGALIVTEDSYETIPAIAVTPMDVTGAGDSFNAALAVGLSEGKSLREAVIYATYAGAYTTMHLGVIDGLPTKSELEAFMEKNKRDDV